MADREPADDAPDDNRDESPNDARHESPDDATMTAASDPTDDADSVPDKLPLPDWSLPRLLAVALAVAIAVVAVAGALTSGAAFGAFNPAWDGTSEFRSLPAESGADTRFVRDVADYDGLGVDPASAGTASSGSAGDASADAGARRTAAVPANRTLAVVLTPREAYRNPTPVRRFVERGGTLVVAEDVGPNGNALLAAVGASARVDGRLVRDEQSYGPSPAFPAVPNVTDHPYTAGVDALELNHGSVVRPGNATVLARTSSVAYLDDDGDDELDDNETLAARPVVTAEPVGDGTVVVVSDPSLFVNAMVDARDNRAFAQALVDAHDRVAVDTSHSGGVPALVAARLAILESPWLQIAVGGLLVLGVALAARAVAALRRRLTPPRPGHIEGVEES